MPGFVNAHTHLAMTMFRGLADDLDLAAFLGRLVPAEGAVLDAARVGTATVLAAVESLTAGVTTAVDMYFFPDAVLDAAAAAGLRVITGPVVLDAPGPDRMPIEARLEWADQWLAEHPARPGWRPVLSPHSTYLVGLDPLERVRELARRHDAAIHIHASETTAEVADVVARHGARPVELLDQLGLLGPWTVLGHGIHLTDDEIDRIAGSGATVAHCPGSNLKLAAGIARVPDLLDAGAGVALGTDGPASSNDLDPFTPMRLAALVHKQSTGDPTVLPAAQVLELATIGGARAVGLADDLGSIESGKLADLVAVSLHRAHSVPVYDPVSAVVYAAGRGDVTRVWAAGRPVVEDSAPALVDALAVIEEMDPLHDVVLAAVRESPGADHLG